MIRRVALAGLIALASFFALLLLRWPPAWDALFGIAYRLDGYAPGGPRHGS